jgi:hypothetical protein
MRKKQLTMANNTFLKMGFLLNLNIRLWDAKHIAARGILQVGK